MNQIKKDVTANLMEYVEHLVKDGRKTALLMNVKEMEIPG